MKTLKQRYFLSTKTFQLLDNRILIREKSVFDHMEWEARYDEIGLDLAKVKSREGIGNVVLFGGLFLACSHMTYKGFTTGTDIKLAFLFLFFCFFWGVFLWWSIQKNFFAHFILSGGNKTLTFFINSPNEKTVRKFIEIIRTRIKERLKADWTTFDPDLTFDDQLEHLRYLKKVDILTQYEFEMIRDYLREQHLIK